LACGDVMAALVDVRFAIESATSEGFLKSLAMETGSE